MMNKKMMMPDSYKELPDEEMKKRILHIKKKYGEKLFIPGHHYQKDEVIQFADATGDSLQLAQVAQQNNKAEYIAFCGVHFMAETADMLTENDQVVVLPDMRAGCSMADMANMQQTNKAWEKLTDIFGETIIPLTYVNSTAEYRKKRRSCSHIIERETYTEMGAYTKEADFISSGSASGTQYGI